MLINFCPWFIMQPKLKFGNLICHAEFQFFFIKKIVAKMLTNKYVSLSSNTYAYTKMSLQMIPKNHIK